MKNSEKQLEEGVKVNLTRVSEKKALVSRFFDCTE